MKGVISLTMLLGLFLAGCSGMRAQRPDVHVLLNDGQILVGELTTSIFALRTDFGTLQFSSDDAGELGPLEGKDMLQSDNLVRLWLRNGSEFVGGWEKPSVQMTLKVGGEDFAIDVPIEKLKRLQFRGEPAYSDKQLYRVLTHSGDDFFGDASMSRIHFESELGSFSPFLAEIAKLERRDPEENTWRIQLKNGTIIHAGIEQDGLELHPAMGPDKVELSWSLIARMEPATMNAPVAVKMLNNPSQYYDNAFQRSVKAEAARTW